MSILGSEPAADSAATPDTTVTAGLDARRIGTPALVFMIIAASAPLTVVAGGVPSNFAVTGLTGIPLSFVVLGIVLILFAIGYAAMSRHVHNAGAFFAYISKGLGKPVGMGAALTALVAYNAMQIGIAGMFGFVFSSFLDSLFAIEVNWWICALIAWVIVGIMGVSRVDFSAKVLGVIVGTEFLVVIVFDIIGLGHSPAGVSAAGLLPGELFAPGVGAALAFSIAAFMGFESGAIYNEEVKDPKRTAGRATIIAVSIIAVFYAFSAWAMVVGEGASNVIGRSQEFGPDLMFVFLGEHAPVWFVDLANLLFLTSLLAALVAFHNIVARYFFALGRDRVLPTFLARTSRRSGAPVAGSLAQSGLALVVIVVFAIVGSGTEDPLFPVVTLFTWLTNMGAFGLVLLMALTALAVIGFLRTRADEYSLWTRAIAPGLAAIGLAALFIAIVVNFNVLIGLEGASVLSWLLPAIVLIPGVIGTIWALRLRSSRPGLYAGIGSGGSLG
ncbi:MULTISPECIES: APC family permease [unclassified Brevibacterium]|uniref:APC family permease n=1 Tax=unclassified Brevibacterium TaxID=2614124 RepID=UPI001E43E641|nr:MULTISPECIES: APC family permease [unclassified Brevibacterium]MCD1287441.1 amino acid permease [Brevibacterium sp. CCUG 69071]MDK8436761.1 APC family permease [Brevibacterium sp. H-BE7]